ncbi:MAG: O-antigen ligase family protein [Alphaproteobacteria bacterium]|nr:O-antigen ligase family protein [Alphaproteobacteria bacterium]
MDPGDSSQVKRRRRRRRHSEKPEENTGEVPAFSEVRFVRRIGDFIVVPAFFLVLLLAPLPMGANRDWAWSPLVLAIAAIAVLCALGTGFGGGFDAASGERGPLLVLIACFAAYVLVAFLQMTTLAPLTASAALYARAREILGQAHAAIPSLAIDAERNTLLKVAAYGLIFLLARTICQDKRRARILLMVFILSGILVMSYAALMHASVGSCYVGSYLKKQGDFTLGERCVMSGTFVNSNSFGCFMGMTALAAVALIASKPPRDDDQDDEAGADDSTLSKVTGARVILTAVALYLLGGLMISKSRAGLAATAIGAMLMVYLLVRGRSGEGRSVRGPLMIGGTIVLVVGIIAGNEFLNKLSLFSDSGSTDRFHIWRATLEAIRLSPWLGWGLGSYADIYTVLQPIQMPIANDLAHSTPLEVVAEMGIPGALVAFMLVLVPWGVCLRGAVRRGSQRDLPIAGFAIAGIAIVHSLVDFSLQMPAIAFMVSALLGMGWAQTFLPREKKKVRRSAKRGA